MAKKHKHPEHVNHERWLVSYADFITLLFATFTALYALSKSDASKAKALAESVRISFGSPANSMIPKSVLDILGIPSDETSAPSRKKKAEGDSTGAYNKPTKDATPNDLAQVKEQLDSYLVTQKLLGKVEAENTGRGLVITLREAGFFESGRSEPLPESEKVLRGVAEQLREFRNPVRVEGHTDSLPVNSFAYESNWELSVARATRILRLLVEKYGVDPERLSAVGYGEFRPVASNATPSGRGRNRRVDIVVLSLVAAHAEAPGKDALPPQPDIESAWRTKPEATRHTDPIPLPH
jgi:chemotaxis protein MotB